MQVWNGLSINSSREAYTRHRFLSRFPRLATHAHFYVTSSPYVFKQTAPVIKLRDDSRSAANLASAILNTNTVCFCLKQVCFNKGAGDDPVRDRYVYAGNYVGMTPIPRDYEADTPNRRRMLALAEEMIGLAEQLPALTMRKLFEREGEAYHRWNASLDGYAPPHPDLPEPFQTAQELEFARDYAVELRRDIRQRMIFLQEEMDWLAYEMYGLLPHAPLAEDYLTPAELETARLELGQRAFEQAGHGYKGDWPKSWHVGAGLAPAPHLPGPTAHLPALSESMQRLIQDRIAIIRTNPDIGLLEDPLYKRRWIPPDTDREFRAALEWWMREMAEWELEQAGRPLHIKEWSRRLMQHQRVRAALEVYAGTPAYDPVTTIEDIVQPEAVPDRPEHYMKPSGLRKLARGEQAFKRGDFSSAGVWKVRGKLNIPRERYIAYTSFEPGWYGWAGWDAEQRAEALVYLLEQAAHAGWAVHHQQCGLRASLRELLPELDHLPAIEQQEFETIAYMCGIRERCFCQAFRDAAAGDRPPGFGEPKLKRDGRKRSEGEQLTFF